MRLPSPASSSSSSDCEEPVVLDDEFERGLESESEPESESDSSRPTKKARKGQYQLETPEITPTKVSRRVQLVEEELASEETDETLIATEEEEEEEEDEMEVDLEERRKSKGKGREVVLDEEIELEIDENIGEEDEDEEREIDSDDDPDVRVEKVDKGKGRAIEVDESMDLDESDLTGVIADDAEEEESDDSDDSTTTPSKKSKPSHRTPQKRRRSSRSPTPLFNFGSARNRGLPASVSKLHSTHSNLRIDTIGYSQQQHKTDAVGWIIEKEVGVVESQGERFVNRATATAEEEDDKPAYATELMKKMISQVGAVLTGNQRFSPMTPTKKFDPRIVKEYPMVEGLERWEKEVRYMIEGVVTKGVGTCVVLLGQRGVGKTLVRLLLIQSSVGSSRLMNEAKQIVERSIEIVQTVHGDDSFIPVRLNGLSQTTDRLAMREIARQLSKDGIIEEGADFVCSPSLSPSFDYSYRLCFLLYAQGSHSATMTTLLRLLEPPTESSLPELPSTSTSPAHHDKPIIFIIDEFDQFAQISRQSFLYSLLDIVQGNKRKSGVGVIGISSRNVRSLSLATLSHQYLSLTNILGIQDCLSLLEKRVRSRCQSQVLEIAPVLNFTTFLKLAQSLLSVDVIVAKKRSRVEGELAKDWNLEIDVRTAFFFEIMILIRSTDAPFFMIVIPQGRSSTGVSPTIVVPPREYSDRTTTISRTFHFHFFKRSWPSL